MEFVLEKIEFRETFIEDPVTKEKQDAIAVIRDGRQVALLPEADRLRRALNLSLNEIEDTLKSFSTIMGRESAHDEREFWKAVLSYKRNQSEV